MDPFSRKDWYDIKAPTMFTVRNIGKTLVTRTQGTKVNQPSAPLRPVATLHTMHAPSSDYILTPIDSLFADRLGWPEGPRLPGLPG